jgi:uncharacterized phiE125 gp8 family phage protein
MAVAAADNALIELEEVQRWLKLEGDEGDDDDFIQEAINDWSDAVETRLGYCIKQAAYTDEVHDGGKPSILLVNTPVASVSSITIDDDELDEDDYTVDLASGIIRLKSGSIFDGGPGDILVSYTGGYVAVPGDLKRAMMQIVALEYYLSGRGRKALAKRGESAAGGSVTYERGPDDQERIMRVIEREYKRR